MLSEAGDPIMGCGKLNAVVTAGGKGKSHPVFGKNKAFLEVSGAPVVARVVSALDASNSIEEIFVVGPKDKLRKALSLDENGGPFVKPIHIYEQRATLYENAWSTFLETLPSYRRGESPESIEQGPEADTAVLIIGADMPLLTHMEVDEFATKCDMDKYDYVLGMTLEDDLMHYYPDDDKPGIHLAYMHFKEGNLRQNNMHIVRPFKVLNRHLVQTMYDHRYQKEFGNIVRLAWEILRKEEGGWGALGNYFLMQLSLLFSRVHLDFLREITRKRTHIDSVIDCVSRLMKTRFSVAYTSLGGATLDIDNEREYEIIQQRFLEWMNYQGEKARQLSISFTPRSHVISDPSPVESQPRKSGPLS